MDALYLINAKTHEIIITKEYKENENNLKVQIFLMEFNKIKKNEKSPFVLINNTIFVYLQNNDNTNESQNNNNDILLLSLISEDVFMLYNYFRILLSQYIKY